MFEEVDLQAHVESCDHDAPDAVETPLVSSFLIPFQHDDKGPCANTDDQFHHLHLFFFQRWTSKTDRIRTCGTIASHLHICSREPCPALSLTRFFVLPSGSRYGTHSDAHQKASDVFSFLDVDRASNSIHCLCSRRRCNANTQTHHTLHTHRVHISSPRPHRAYRAKLTYFTCRNLCAWCCHAASLLSSYADTHLRCFVSARVPHPFRV